jgi:hypothetical protein
MTLQMHTQRKRSIQAHDARQRSTTVVFVCLLLQDNAQWICTVQILLANRVRCQLCRSGTCHNPSHTWKIRISVILQLEVFNILYYNHKLDLNLSKLSVPKLCSVFSWNIKHGLSQNTTLAAWICSVIKGSCVGPITFMITTAGWLQSLFNIQLTHLI